MVPAETLTGVKLRADTCAGNGRKVPSASVMPSMAFTGTASGSLRSRSTRAPSSSRPKPVGSSSSTNSAVERVRFGRT